MLWQAMHGFPGVTGKWNGLLQFALLLPILWIHRNWFINGVKTLLHGAPAMDTLVALGSGTGIIYSLVLIFQGKGGGHLFFEASGMILVLVSTGKFLEEKTKRHAADVISKLVRLTPDTATVLQDGRETQIKVRELRKDQIVIIRPGDQLPVDGIITEGYGILDESAVTGESVPVYREKDAIVRAGTLNTDGFFHFRTTAVGSDTSLAKIIALIRETGTKKLRISRLADTVSGKFVPAVILLALLTFLVWYFLLHATLAFAMTAGIAVLLISCPCALGLATPLAVMAGSGRAAEQSILFRSGEALETAGKITTVVFDKTGTLTTGESAVSAVLPAENITEEQLLKLAMTLENGSRHPYAKAVLNYGTEHKITPDTCSDFQVIPGRGIKAVTDEKIILGGNRNFLQEEHCIVPDPTDDTPETQLYFAFDSKYYGSIRISDPLRPDTIATLERLKELQITPFMLTGDQESTAKAIAAQCGITGYKAGVLPDEKESVIRSLQDQGEIVAMVGDGINDAPALLRADVGIAVNGSTDIATDSADVILLRQGLQPLAETVMISRSVVRNIKINLFWAFAYNVLAIPLAAGVFYPLTGWLLPPAIGAAAMCASSFCVVLNALRLRYLKTV